MSDIPEPELSPAFTLEDIRKIRDWNYERRKTMTPEEFREDSRKRAERVLALLAQPSDPTRMAEAQRKIDEACEKHKKAG